MLILGRRMYMPTKQKEDSNRCVLTLPLLTEPWQEHIIEKRFKIIEHLKNQLISIELRKLKNLQRTKAYKNLIKQIESVPKSERTALYKERNKMLKDAGFSQYTFMDDMAGKKSLMQKHFESHINVQIAHKAAIDVWSSFEKFLFGTGQIVHYQKRGTLSSVASKSPKTGMFYYSDENIFKWSGGGTKPKGGIILCLRVAPVKTNYEKEMVANNEIKYYRVVRKWMKTKYKYYLQITFAGKPADKHHEVSTGRVGIDIGTQTIAIASDKSVKLLELADKVNKNHIKKCELQRKLDRSRRYTNPDNFNPDGTVKRGTKGHKLKWNKSKHYIEIAGKIRELERKNADIRKYQHTCLANDILAMGNQIYIEPMNYKGLQKRAKETQVDEKGRYKKKKRFGKSLANKAPAMFVTILKTKAEQHGGEVYEVDIMSYRASQCDHTTGEYTKHGLNDRWRILGNGDKVQRDLYSAFLIKNSNKTHDEIDLDKCSKTYDNFKKLHDKEIENIRNEVKLRERKNISSYGIA